MGRTVFACSLLVLVLALVLAHLPGCGDNDADAASHLGAVHAAPQATTMQSLGAALAGLEGWAAGNWAHPPAADAELGARAAPVPRDVSGLLAVLRRGLEEPWSTPADARRVPHRHERKADAQLAVRLLAAQVDRRDWPAATRALARVRAACTHCHDRCGR